MATDHTIILEYLKNNAPDNMCTLDIGSKSGKWLDPFVGTFSKGTFHCFEALPEQYERLKHRYRRCPTVHSYNVVLSNKKEPVTFYRDIVRRGWSGMRKHQYLEEFDEIHVESNTVDSFNLTPYFIKIDVEGAELFVFQGSVETLKNTKIIFFECNEVHYKEYNYTSEDLYNFLIESNFEIFGTDFNKISKESFVYLTADARRYENPKQYQSNFIAIKKER